ncbi:hypothetical protein DR864_09535 [Runella rosea]|uniref:Antirepressor protein C-terminal domain-containing protein n=1 Tax=Runella rosea TaxID=2259595 RepID=A0A344TH38_9BACT|nr:phage antirepressor KilAC domain-containing protein [Runella rosea]AXE17959.1 hypothetical protein DR864_09535 [Runella rosea]
MKIKLKELLKDSYSMKETAELLGFKNRAMMFSFLRRYNIINGSLPAREFLIMEYFDVQNYKIRNRKGECFKAVPLIRVTQAGVKFIEDLHHLLTKDQYAPHFTQK